MNAFNVIKMLIQNIKLQILNSMVDCLKRRLICMKTPENHFIITTAVSNTNLQSNTVLLVTCFVHMG